ncbi:MAG: hypothetical protein GXX87_01350 [Euryarchaeota archaeon]|nr:hypothetical protein [Euryarchaeota archaeon]
MDPSPGRSTRVRQGAILGAVVGVFLFIFFYLVAGQLIYLMFIPISCGMGAAVQYMKDDGYDDGD